MNLKKYLSPVLGACVLIICLWILFHKLKNIELHTIINQLQIIPYTNWLLAIGAALLSYIALATYDYLALMHIRKKVSWLFVLLCSFTSYALSHNIGASVFSGAVIRYRAYKTKGLTGSEVAVLVAFCSFTFVLGIILIAGILLIFSPEVFQNLWSKESTWVLRLLGSILLFLLLLYVLGSWLHLPPLKINKKTQLIYPKLPIVFRQFIIAPLEIICSSFIIHIILPEAVRPDFIVTLGVFIASFSGTLLSNAPAGGIGVLELIFLTGMPNVPKPELLSALIVFRLLYLIIPLIISLFIVIVFEYKEWVKKQKIRGKS